MTLQPGETLEVKTILVFRKRIGAYEPEVQWCFDRAEDATPEAVERAVKELRDRAESVVRN